MKDRKMSFYNRIVKRMLDIICSLAAIMCLSVLYLPICRLSVQDLHFGIRMI